MEELICTQNGKVRLDTKGEPYWFFVDGSNRAFVNLMKVAFDESLPWNKDSVNPDIMKVLPVNFSTEHKQMLAHLHILINKEYLAIPKEWDKLIISLRTAYANEYSLDREQTSYSDTPILSTHLGLAARCIP